MPPQEGDTGRPYRSITGTKSFLNLCVGVRAATAARASAWRAAMVSVLQQAARQPRQLLEARVWQVLACGDVLRRGVAAWRCSSGGSGGGVVAPSGRWSRSRRKRRPPLGSGPCGRERGWPWQRQPQLRWPAALPRSGHSC